MCFFVHFCWDKHVKHPRGSSGCVEWVPGSFFNATLCRTGTKTGARKHCLCNKTILHIWTTIFNIYLILHLYLLIMLIPNTCADSPDLFKNKNHILKNNSRSKGFLMYLFLKVFPATQRTLQTWSTGPAVDSGPYCGVRFNVWVVKCQRNLWILTGVEMGGRWVVMSHEFRTYA